MAHLDLVTIHPWRDGNGRTARALHTLILARTGELAAEFSSIEEWLGEQTNTLQYYDALQSAQGGHFRPERDAHAWLKFVFTAHHRQAQRVQRRYEWTVRMWNDLAGLAEQHGHATGRTYTLAGAAAAIAETAAAAVRGAGRDPYA
ncbi:Fic family protein [Actinoplanes sp. GCM10030250]|uniref:Fic family protein n=1 Tax=Actinoplanes sp. GCM10030250 TaxID=3273376 RepID=UPI003616511A